MSNEIASCDVDQINVSDTVAVLDSPKGVLPLDAIEAVRAHRELFVPELIRLIRDATLDARGDDVPDTNGHFFALFLLIEFRAAEALPVILEAMSLPDEIPFELFGDAVHEALPYVIPAMAADKLDEIVALIRTSELNEWVQWALLGGLKLLVPSRAKSRDEIVHLLRELLREAMENEDDVLVTSIVHELTFLNPDEAYDDIVEAYSRGSMDEDLICLEDVDRHREMGEDATLERLEQEFAGINNLADRLKDWGSFQKDTTPAMDCLTQGESRLPRPPSATAPPSSVTVADQVPNETPPVGRNAPCPCGSGKIFKTCCGSGEAGR